ncbi:unnamed protein product [Caenorhabditis auriculariae]|uniref:Uncharacterized protein n=1 Tax=Caenorhabditis auriculariae TaxID=2777116 RepID=A0A8S1H8I4_9PELO|nr:unnamed protein product [Caenorhabditis auriculariae]
MSDFKQEIERLQDEVKTIEGQIRSIKESFGQKTEEDLRKLEEEAEARRILMNQEFQQKLREIAENINNNVAQAKIVLQQREVEQEVMKIRKRQEIDKLVEERKKNELKDLSRQVEETSEDCQLDFQHDQDKKLINRETEEKTVQIREKKDQIEKATHQLIANVQHNNRVQTLEANIHQKLDDVKGRRNDVMQESFDVTETIEEYTLLQSEKDKEMEKTAKKCELQLTSLKNSLNSFIEATTKMAKSQLNLPPVVHDKLQIVVKNLEGTAQDALQTTVPLIATAKLTKDIKPEQIEKFKKAFAKLRQTETDIGTRQNYIREGMNRDKAATLPDPSLEN